MQLISPSKTVHLSGSSEYICNILKEECRRMADEALAAICPLPKEYVLFALHEFMKNTLHGEKPVVEVIWLPDGSLLLIARDLVGTDQLDPRACFKLATAMIEAAVGPENYLVRRSGDMYESFLRIPVTQAMTAAQ